MSIISSITGGRQSNVFDFFSLYLWDPFQNFPIGRPGFSKETTQSQTLALIGRRPLEAYVFKADLLGLKEEGKVKMEEGNVLQISGEMSKESEKNNNKWHHVERSSGKFLCRFKLPDNAKVDQVKAAMENGVITITVPKEEMKKPEVKSIEISG